MRSSSWTLCASALGLALLVAAPALAQEVSVGVMVIHASQSPGPVDPEAERVRVILSRDFRFQSWRVMQRNRMRVPMKETRRVELPSGRSMKVCPLQIESKGLLMSVEMNGQLDTQVVLPRRKPFVIGAGGYQDGKLIIAIEPDY